MSYDLLFVCVVLAVALVGMTLLLIWDGSDPWDWLGGRRDDDRTVRDRSVVVPPDWDAPGPLTDHGAWRHLGDVPSLREDVEWFQSDGGDRTASQGRGPARLTGSRRSDAQ